MSQVGTGVAHLSATRHSLDRPTPLAPEPIRQLREVGIATKPQQCWWEGIAGVSRREAGALPALAKAGFA